MDHTVGIGGSFRILRTYFSSRRDEQSPEYSIVACTHVHSMKSFFNASMSCSGMATGAVVVGIKLLKHV